MTFPTFFMAEVSSALCITTIQRSFTTIELYFTTITHFFTTIQGSAIVFTKKAFTNRDTPRVVKAFCSS